MIYNLYVIFDKVAGVYSVPFASLSDATAIRQFEHQIVANLMAEPTDFELYSVGSFDVSSGVITSTSLRFVSRGSVSNEKV